MPIQRFYGYMKWFDCAEQPKVGFEGLPVEFSNAKKLWNKGSKKNIEQIIKILSPFVGACFMPDNLNGWRDLFVDDSNGGEFGVYSDDVDVVGIDFSSGPIPLCNAQATFDVKVTEKFQVTDLEQWQQENDNFHWAISFFWNIPTTIQTQGLDLTWGNNSGCEVVPWSGKKLAERGRHLSEWR